VVSLRSGLLTDGSLITGEKCFLPQDVKTRALAHSAPRVVSTHGSSQGRDKKLNSQPHLMSSLIIRVAIPLLPHDLTDEVTRTIKWIFQRHLLADSPRPRLGDDSYWNVLCSLCDNNNRNQTFLIHKLRKIQWENCCTSLLHLSDQVKKYGIV
jgi:hypothetical protein